MRRVLMLGWLTCVALATAVGQSPQPEIDSSASSSLPADPRRGDLTNLNGYFPFHPVGDLDQWAHRQAEIRRRILVSQGLWPLPTKTPLRAVIHGRVDREDYVVDRVYFESAPGHFVTGSLYRPKGKTGPFPAILSPHGHWSDGRFYDAGEQGVKGQIASGAEQDEIGGRYPIQARAVQLARMGCLVLVYDMTGNADSIQIAHRPAQWSHLDTPTDWGFMSVQADLRLQNMMGLQTWNSIRAIDFLLELDDVDPTRIGVTGASGGGTQSMIVAAVDDRIAASMPCVMVSTAMQGGCTCENAPLLRIGQGNIDIAAATAPRPLGLTAADDWTIELESKGYPDLLRLYEMVGHPERLTAVFHTQFKHNYNLVNRLAMYSFFNRHFELGWDEPIAERPYVPLTREEATVWDDEHPAPRGDQVGDSHEIRLLKMATADSGRQMSEIVSGDAQRFQSVVGGAWETILGRRLDQVGDVRLILDPETETSASTSTLPPSTLPTSSSGKLLRVDNGEQVAVRRFQPQAASRGTIILVTDRGLASLQAGDGGSESIRQWVEAGYVVMAADLFMQEVPDLQAQPMWFQPNGDQGWKRFSGYTYGYNHSLFVQRVHDILTMIAAADQSGEGPIHLVGRGSIAGPLALAARSQAGDRVANTVVDLKGFRFETLRRHDDPMFVPGAVKYLDVDGLMAVCAPAPLRVLGDDPFPVAEQLDDRSNDRDALQRASSNADVLQLINEGVPSPAIGSATDAWPQFRGPNGDGVTDADLPTEWSPETHIVWRRELPGSGWSSPVAADGRIYLTAAIPSQGDGAESASGQTDQTLALLIVDAETGELLRSVAIMEQNSERPPKMHSKNSHASPTAVIDGERIYVHFGYQGTACLTTEGEVIWINRDLYFRPTHGNGGSPILVGNRLIFTCDGDKEPKVVALDADTGELAWQVPRPVSAKKTFSFCTPSVFMVNGEPQVIAPGSDGVLALDPSTGETIWDLRYEGYSVVPKPVMDSGLVFISTGFDSAKMLAIRPTGRGLVTDSHLQWQLDRNVPKTPSMIAQDGLVYSISDDGIATCVEAETGDLIYRKRIGGNFSASPLLAGDHLYFTSEEGVTTVIKRGRDFETVAENDLGERTLASLGVLGDSILLRTANALYRIAE